MARDSNPFYKGQQDEPAPETQWQSRADSAVAAVLPFRNSELRLGLDASRISYSKTSTDQRWATGTTGALTLRLSTGDVLDFGVERIAGIADVLRFDPGGEAVFQGESFTLASYRAAATRRVPGRRGWDLEVVREDLNFDKGVTASFFDYRGWRGALAYREPLSSSFWIVGGWEGRRFDDFRADVPEELGVPFRTETSDTVHLGAESQLAGGHSWHVKVGRAALAFGGENTGRLRTWTVDGGVELALGAATRLSAVVARRPFPSFFFENDAYISSSAVVVLNRTGPTGLTVGASLAVGKNAYDEPVPQRFDTDVQVLRRDRLARLELYAKVPLGQRVGLRFSAVGQRRTSTYVTGDYEGVAVFGGVIFGWL